MNDFESLTRDYGFKPQGKSAPMAASKSSSNLSSNNADAFADLGNFGSGSGSNAPKPQKFDDFGDIFGGSARFTAKSGADSSLNLDSMFTGASDSGPKHSSLPIFDKPVYDDDIFEGLPGMKTSSGAKFDNVFAAESSKENGGFDDLLGGFVKAGTESKKGPGNGQKDVPDFDDLIPGFGGSSLHSERPNSEANRPTEPASSSQRTTSSAMDDPFSVFESSKPAVNASSGLFSDPLDEIGKLNKSSSTKYDDIYAHSTRAYDDVDPFDSLGRDIPNLSSDNNNWEKEKSSSRTESSKTAAEAYPSSESVEKPSRKSHDSGSKKTMHADNGLDPHGTFFDMPSVNADSYKSSGQRVSSPSGNATSGGANTNVNMNPRSEEKESSDDIWLTVSEIPLFTQPTSAPPPSRPPPPIPLRKKVNESTKRTQSFRTSQSASFSARSSAASSIDEFEDFAMGRNRSRAGEYGTNHVTDDMEMSSAAAASAAAMKEAMDKAEAKFRHAREARERESSKGFRSKEAVDLEKEERSMPNAQERAFREKQERLDRERMQREREEEEREQMRIEKEREEKEREQRRLEREREKARQAVERATREARERAAADARLRAERAAVEKAAAEARERAERAAVQRAQAEARERAAAEAKERAERAASEAREKAAAAREKEKFEARARAERAAVERAAAEARERAAAEARERAAAAAKANQQKNDDDLESFFSMGRASSAPRSRTTSSDPFETQFQSKQGPEPAKTSAGNSANIRKASSTTNIVDDLSSIFGAAPSAGEFQDIDGESEERRRARLERHQRTQERAAKALAEKNQRDLQAQREQAERHRIAETLDVEIKRWAAGKEGNLRAMLSTLQYVLWPECGWQPISLTDLITAAAVKKAYRKATLCIHPDKVQQKGANLQQKYIAEKVFDLLKEAWNKFNSEELF